MRIVRVTATPLHSPEPTPASWLGESLVANPMSIYPRYKARRSSWGATWGPDVIVRVYTDDGVEGIGGKFVAGLSTSASATLRPFVRCRVSTIVSFLFGPAEGGSIPQTGSAQNAPFTQRILHPRVGCDPSPFWCDERGGAVGCPCCRATTGS
jgi:hypothetical protein